MAEKVFDEADIGAFFEEMGGEAIAEGVDTDFFLYA